MLEIIIGVVTTLLALLGASTVSGKLKKKRVKKLEQELEAEKAEKAVLEYEQEIAESIDSDIIDARERKRMRDLYQREGKEDGDPS